MTLSARRGHTLRGVRNGSQKTSGGEETSNKTFHLREEDSGGELVGSASGAHVRLAGPHCGAKLLRTLPRDHACKSGPRGACVSMLGGEPAPGEVRLCLARLRSLLESLPFFVAPATPRWIGNAWDTGRWNRCRAAWVARQPAAMTMSGTTCAVPSCAAMRRDARAIASLRVSC